MKSRILVSVRLTGFTSDFRTDVASDFRTDVALQRLYTDLIYLGFVTTLIGPLTSA